MCAPIRVHGLNANCVTLRVLFFYAGERAVGALHFYQGSIRAGDAEPEVSPPRVVLFALRFGRGHADRPTANWVGACERHRVDSVSELRAFIEAVYSELPAVSRATACRIGFAVHTGSNQRWVRRRRRTSSRFTCSPTSTRRKTGRKSLVRPNPSAHTVTRERTRTYTGRRRARTRACV